MTTRRGHLHGISAWLGTRAAHIPLRERLTAIRDAGFDSVSLWWGDKDCEIAALGKEAATKLVRDSGLILENVHVPHDDCNLLWSANAEDRDAIVARHVEWLDECARFGVHTMVMHLTRHRVPPESSYEGLAAMGRIVSEAERHGVRVAVENTRRFGHIERVLDAIDSPFLGLCYDSSHDRIYSRDRPCLLEKYGRRLLALHLSDNDGSEDSHWLPGSGVIDWNAIARKLRAANYTGSVFLEVFMSSEESATALTSREFLTQAREKAQWLEKAIESTLVDTRTIA